MASCVDTKAAARYVAENGLDVAPDLIKHLVFKWQLENNTETEWPSKEYILNNIQGESFEASDVQRELYNKLGLNEVKTFPTESARTQYIENYLKNNGTYCFPEKSIYLYSGAKGDFKLSVGRPSNFSELEAIKERTVADGTFMKAPNGNKSNLNERQWLHVRTRAFKDWFGDWERLAPKTRNDQFFTTPTDATPRLIERLEHIAESSDKYGRLAKIILDNKLLPYNLRYFKVDNNRSDIRSYKKEVPGLAGSWSSVASYIEVLGNNAPEEAVNRVILHELIHFNTEALLDEYKRSPNSIPENQRAAIAELYNIIDYAKSHLKEDIKNNPSKYKEIRDRQGDPLSTRVFYAFDGHTDVEIDEFISEVFTNPAFQEVLNNIPYKTDKKKSIWNKIIDAITSIFGLPIKQGSVLEAALRESSLFLSKENSLTEISRNTSKVVDENGEPLVVYHGTRTADKLRTEGFSKDFSGKGNRGANQGNFYFTNNIENAEYTGVKAHELNPLIDVITSVYDLFNTADLPTIKSLYETIDSNFKQIEQLEEQRKDLNSKSLIGRFIDTILNILKLRHTNSVDEINNSIQNLKSLNDELTHKIEVLNLYDSGLSFLKGERNKAVVNTLNFIKENVNTDSPFRQVAANRLINLLYGTEDLTYSPDVLGVFLNIRTPLESDFGMSPTDRNPLKGGRFSGELLAYNQREQALLNELQDDKYDGSISRNKFDVLFGDVYITKNSNQIKSATDNIGTYSEYTGKLDYQINAEESNALDVNALPQTMSIDDVYTALRNTYEPNSQEAKLTELVFNALRQLPITFEKADLDAQRKNALGVFVASDKKILINKNRIGRNTLLHECIHAVTSYYLKHPNIKSFPKEVQIAVKEIEECYEILVDDLLYNQYGKFKLVRKNATWDEKRDAIKTLRNMIREVGDGGNSTYGLTSVTEMIAELSNPVFVARIKEADERLKGKNIFKRLIDSIFSLFKTKKDYTSIEKTVKDAFTKLLTNPSVELYNQYSQLDANLKQNIKDIKKEASILLDADESWLTDKILSKLENVEASPEKPYVDINIELAQDELGSLFSTRGNISGRILRDADLGTIIYCPLGMYMTLNGKVETINSKITIPVRILDSSFMQLNTFSIVKGKNNASKITNIKPLLQNEEPTKAQEQQPTVTQDNNGPIPIKYTGKDAANQDLSNFAPRRFTVDMSPLGIGLGNFTAESVEQAYQWCKFIYPILLYKGQNGWTDENRVNQLTAAANAIASLGTNSSAIQSSGKNGLRLTEAERSFWEANKHNIMHALMYNSFQQNPQVKKRLLDTGDRPFTHPVAGEWRTKFPELLAQVRQELRGSRLQHATQNWTRQSAEKDPRTLYIFTDNTDRTSGKLPVNPNSWYARRYGANAKYPTMTQAVLRGLDNARPISTVKMFYSLHKGVTNPRQDKNSKALWTDADLATAMKVIDAEFQDIFDAWNELDANGKPKYDRIVLGPGDGILNGEISNITEQRTPRLYKYFQLKLQELAQVVDGKLVNMNDIANRSAAYGVTIDGNLKRNSIAWQKNNPNGIVAYRKYSGNKESFTLETVLEGWIGNPFSIKDRGPKTVQQFYDWIITGNNFGNEFATEEFRHSIIAKILASPDNAPVLYYTELGRPSHATVLGYLIRNKHLLPKPQGQLVGYTNHSGGAKGSDSYWTVYGAKRGTVSNNYYHQDRTPLGNVEQSQADFIEGTTQAKQASASMKRYWNDKYGNLLARNWNQVKYADAVFAIGHIVQPGEKNSRGYDVQTVQVDGGTGYAVQMAMNAGKPVYVFDQTRQHWYKYENGKWYNSDTPILSRNFAGIGTREINEAGKKAIEDVYAKTAEYEASRNTFEPVQSKNDPERFADKKESEKVISSDKTILTNEELKYWNEHGVGEKPRILSASERTDPAFHVKEILDILNGKKTIPEWGVVNGKRQKIGEVTGKDFAGLYLITKHDGLPMLDLLETKIPKLIHFSITTLGGTKYEPGVMKYNDLLDRIQEYLNKGLDPDAVTIRIDPIVPGVTNFRDVENVVRRASQMGIKRIRFSVMDAYQNTREAMKDIYDFNKYYNGFHAKPEYINEISDFMLQMKEKYDIRLGTCAEPLVKPGIMQDGCLSVAAINEMLGTNIEDKGKLNNTQRANCSCYGGKIDALAYNSKCASHCIYCYAKHENDKAISYYDEDGYLRDNIYTRTTREPIKPKPSIPIIESNETINEVEQNNDPIASNTIWRQIEQDPEYQQSVKLDTQLRTLTETLGIPMSKIEEAATEIGNFLSDVITQIQKDPESIMGQIEMDGSKSLPITKGLSRMEIISRVGPDRLLNYVKEAKFNTEKFNMKQWDNQDLVDETDAFYNNWDILVNRSLITILENEKVKFVKNEKTGALEAQEGKLDTDPDDFSGQAEQDEVEETHANQQEWGIENKSVDLLNDVASPLVRDAFRQCYDLDEKGSVIQSERRINKRRRMRDAMNSVLSWTANSQSLSEATERLKEKAKKETWLQPIVRRLEDTSGRESDFQNQIWTVLCNANVVYTVVKRQGKKWIAVDVSSKPARKEQLRQIKALFKMGEHPLFTQNGISLQNLSNYSAAFNALKDVKELRDKGQTFENKELFDKAVTNIGYIANLLGFFAPKELIQENLTDENFTEIYNNIDGILRRLDSYKGDPNYNPFKVKNEDESFYAGGIANYLQNLLTPLTASLEDSHITTIFDNGKMYQTRVKPSALLLHIAKFHLDDAKFMQFILDNYAGLPWYRDQSEPDPTKGWRNTILGEMVNNKEVRENFRHHVQLNFNKKQYMKNMNPVEYTLASISEFFAADPLKKTTGNVYANFRMTIQSNKPTSEYLTMKCVTGPYYKETIVDQMSQIFDQELTRIQTLQYLNAKKGDAKYIKNFSEQGKKFCLVDFMNVYFEGGERANTELGKLLRDKLDGKKIDEGRFLELKKGAIMQQMNARIQTIIDGWKADGTMEEAKSIANIRPSQIEKSLEFFAWNDAIATMNIMEIFVTDPAYYKGADDLQKRLAELHAPGIRPNIEARDYKGERLSDGTHRSVSLVDHDKYISNIIDNLDVVFSRKIVEAKDKPAEKEGWIALKNRLIGKDGLFRTEINVTDGQAYNCPTSFRKKAFMFGKWNRHKEEIYQRIRKGDYNYTDVENAFQDAIGPTFGVLKPTTFGHSVMETGAPAPLLNKISVPTYNKNSEYALIIADAILQGEETGKPNLLRAIYDVMEESHWKRGENGEDIYQDNGIDTIQFISAIKSGEGKSVNIIQFKDVENGEEKAKAFLRKNIYTDPAAGTYNKDVVRELPFDSFALQMDVANHFQNHEQIFGSQDRMIIPSELPEVDVNGETILYKTPKHPEGVTAKEFRKEYEETLAKNIEQSVDLLEEELGLKSLVPIDRKFAISKLLRREILSNPRYGLDLYTALSIDAVKQDFRIPLGDPVNSKRVEALLNSIIKDRVNKQKIAGGPVVQVTNFGTSKQLNIRFKHKNGGLLKTREEYAAAMRENDPNVTEKHINWQYNEYRKRFQGGIAYMEVYASPYVKDIFEQFADAEGNIDIANIEKVNPELLKMIGYRIPTEAKYSISPLKIVGFLPRIAGEAIMMPYEITLLNGSDFDVDKMYLMTKKLNITKKQITNREVNAAIKSLENIATINITEDGEIQTSATLKDIKKAARIGLDFAQEYPNSTLFDKDKNSLVNRLARAINLKKLITPEEEYALYHKYNDEMEYNLRRFKVRKGYASAEPSTYGEDIELDAETRAEADRAIAEERRRLEEYRDIDIDMARDAYRASKVKERVKQFLNEDRFMSSKYDDEITAELRKAYLDFTYKVEEPTSEKELRDNATIDMQWEILTHEATAPEILNPGGFDPQKKMGYAIDAYKKRATKKNGSRYTWDELMKLSIDELKDLSTNNVSLMFFDTQAKYYKQNSAAGSLTGIFAVHRTAFATLENDGLLVDVNEACGLTSERVIKENGEYIKVTENVPFKVAGIEFGGEKNGKMLICKRFDTKGGSVGKSLGSSVAAAVDAGKVPVLNLMNINGTTANTYLTMLKMGVPFETAAIFLGQQVISDLLEEHARKNVGNNYAGLYELIDKKIADFGRQLGISEGRRQAGTIDTEDLTESQMIDGLINVDARTAYKTLTALKYFMKLSNAMRLPVAATRLNSINSAVGPLVTNNIIEEIKRINLTENSCIYASDGVTKMGIEDIINLHPILREFYKAYNVADRAFTDMPANSNNFRRILNTLSLNGLDRRFFRDPKLMTALSDFYQTYLAYASGALKHKELKQFIEEFPRTFVKRRYKDMYKDNKLIQAIQFNVEGSSELVTLNIDTTGQDESYKSPLRSAWADLYKSGEHGKKLAISLAKYFMYRGGVGFSPKTALSLLPVEVKEQIPHYTDSFKNSNAPVINASAVIDMFIRNNCSDNRLVPPISYDKLKGTFQGDTFMVTTEEAIEEFNNRMYFKTKINGQDVVYRKSNEIMNGQNVVGIEYTQVPALGNNKAYVEISLAGTIKEARTPSTIEDVDSSQEEFVPEDNNAMEYSDNVVEPEGVEYPSPADMDTMLRKVFENSGFTVEAAKAHKDVYGNNQEQLAAYKDYVHKFIETRLGELGINVGKEQEKLINELTERIC